MPVDTLGLQTFPRNRVYFARSSCGSSLLFSSFHRTVAFAGLALSTQYSLPMNVWGLKCWMESVNWQTSSLIQLTILCWNLRPNSFANLLSNFKYVLQKLLFTEVTATSGLHSELVFLWIYLAWGIHFILPCVNWVWQRTVINWLLFILLNTGYGTLLLLLVMRESKQWSFGPHPYVHLFVLDNGLGSCLLVC